MKRIAENLKKKNFNLATKLSKSKKIPMRKITQFIIYEL